MSVKTTNVTLENNIVDDLEEKQEVEEITQPADDVNLATLEALKQKMKAKKEEAAMPIKIVEEKKRTIRLGVVGSGQAGGRIGEEFYNLGYEVVAFNTAQVDLDSLCVLPDAQKLLLQGTIGGAGKSLDLGREVAEANREYITEFIDTKLGDVDGFLLTSSMAGGSGSGSISTLVDILNQTGKPVIGLLVLPMQSDDYLNKSNAYTSLSTVSQLLKDKRMANCFIVDNSKIETILSEVSVTSIFSVANKAIVEEFDVWNQLSNLKSKIKSIDNIETAKLLFDADGFSIFGSITIPEDVLSDETAISEAIMANLTEGLLASDFSLDEAKYIGFSISASPAVWAKISNASLSYANSILEEVASKAEAKFQGIYEDVNQKASVKINSIFVGMGLPTKRVNSLKEEAKKGMEKVQAREKGRSATLEMEGLQSQEQSAADKVKSLIKAKSSTFNKNFGVNKDFRK